MLLWEDLLNRVNSDMIEALQLYMSKFPETKVHVHGTWWYIYVLSCIIIIQNCNDSINCNDI